VVLTTTKLVGTTGFHASLERLGLALKRVNSLLLHGKGRLHLVEHSHLLLLELLDVVIGACLFILVVLLLLDVSVGSVLVLVVFITSLISGLLLAHFISECSIFHLAFVLGFLFILEHAVVMVKELIEVVS